MKVFKFWTNQGDTNTLYYYSNGPMEASSVFDLPIAIMKVADAELLLGKEEFTRRYGTDMYSDSKPFMVVFKDKEACFEHDINTARDGAWDYIIASLRRRCVQVNSEYRRTLTGFRSGVTMYTSQQWIAELCKGFNDKILEWMLANQDIVMYRKFCKIMDSYTIGDVTMAIFQCYASEVPYVAVIGTADNQ